MSEANNCRCECGQVQFNVTGTPLMRGFCHCTICQAFNEAPFADITLFRPADVIMPDDTAVEFRAYRPPPAVQRGKCRQCGKPAIEKMHIFPLPKAIIVPSQNIRDDALLPEPSMHVFYNSRVAEVDDDLPKYSGYLKSQLAFSHKLIVSMLRR